MSHSHPMDSPRTPARTVSGWGFAFALSIAAHAALLFGLPRGEFGMRELVLPKPLEARIVQAAAAPASVAAPEVLRPAPVDKPKPQPRARPKPVARPSPPPAAPPVAIPEPTPAVVIAQSEQAPVLSEAASDAAAPKPERAAGTGESVPTEAPDAAAAPVAAREPDVADAVKSVTPARHPLKSATLVYDLSYGENPMRVGRVTHQWNYEGERYFAETIVEATGLFSVLYGGQYVQRSWGTIGPAGLVPSEYFVQRGRPDRGETALFDWDARRVAFQWRNERRDATLVPGTQDPISMLHQIYYMQPLPEAKTLSVASSRKFGEYLFQFIGEEQIDTPMGPLTALHVRRKDDDADHVDVWVDPQRGYLPVRVHFVDRRGYVFDQRVREMRFEAAQ